jgi:hypothetical protein
MEKEISLVSGSTNLLGIQSPEDYTCEIAGISSENAVLWIRAVTETLANPVNIVFRGAYFFDGPTQWVGADFQTSPADEAVRLLETLGLLENIPQEHFLPYTSGFFLLKTIMTKYPIRILVRSGFISEDIPSEFENRH